MLLTATLSLTDQLVWDVFLVLLVPFVALGLAAMRPLLHWASFVAMAAATAITLARIEESESSTAGFGVIVLPLLLTVAVLLTAVTDRAYEASSRGAG